MFKLRDFRIGWRLLLKEPAYSAVVILGLAVGVASCFLLLGFVRHSFSYDAQVPERDRVYAMKAHMNLPSFGDDWIDGAGGPARAAMLASGQPVLATAFFPNDIDVRAGTRVQSLHAFLVDPDFEKIFAPRVLAGDLHAALTRPDALALTRESAMKLFGTPDAVGKTLQQDQRTYTVAAVVADQPSATTMPFEALAGTAGLMLQPDRRDFIQQVWSFVPGRVYVKLLPGADVRLVLDAVQQALRQWMKQRPADVKDTLGGRDLMEHRLTPIADTYLDPDVRSAIFSQHGDRQAVLGLAAVAGLILLLAAANYVNLATVRALARQREIAVRKVMGASAPAVARQFLAESVLVSLIATGIGLLFAWLLLPVFSDLVQRRFDAMFSPGALALAVALAVLLGLLAGAYPAWSALRVRVTSALTGRGASETARGLWIRRTLTILQFAAAMGLTATTLAIAWQTRYASTLDPGFDPAPMLMFPVSNDMRDARTRALRDEIARLPDVAGAAVSQPPFGSNNHWITTLQRPGGLPTELNLYTVGPEFFDVYGVRPAFGRLYHRGQDRMQDQDRVVINAAAAHRLGFVRPEEAVGKTLAEPGNASHPRLVVGIAPAMRHGSAREAQQAAVYYLGDQVGLFTVRVRANEEGVKRALEALLPRYFPNETFYIERMPSIMFNQFYADDMRLAQLLAASSVIATGLAAFGIYVLAAYSVRRREKEIVLRKLYGANGAAIAGLVAREFASLLGAGALLGLPLAWLAIQRYLGTFSERAPIGGWTIAAALLVAGIVALLATLRHALAAVHIRPALALRE